MAETNIILNGGEEITTFGGEEGILPGEYGISFDGEVFVSNLSPIQAVQLVCILGDHLLLNGHKFKIMDTNEQDQKQRLVYVKN